MKARLLLILLITMTTVVSGIARDRITLWTAARGFAPYCAEGCDTMQNLSDGVVYHLAPSSAGEGDFVWRVQMSALNNAADKRYTYLDRGGKKRNVSHPAYGLALVSAQGDTLLIKMQTIKGLRDEITGTPDKMDLRVMLLSDSARVLHSSIIDRKRVDLYTGVNGFSISRHGGLWQISMGNHDLHSVAEFTLPAFDVREIGYMLSPGAALRLKYASMKEDERCMEIVPLDTPIAEDDPLSGEWELRDYNIDTSLLRPGGMYKIAIRPNPEREGGYRLIYLEGATAGADTWAPGMVKGELSPTGLHGVYDVVWYDAEHRPLSKDVRGQADVDTDLYRYSVLTIRFPYQDSSITLHRVR